MHHVAVAVAEHLHLDVARRDDDLLDQHGGIAECGLRLALRALQRRGKIVLAFHQAHAAPATAGHRLDHDRIADALGFLGERLGRLAVALVARHHRHAGLGRDRLGVGLAAHLPHGGGRRPDELDARFAHGLGEIGVFGQEAVARMDAVGAGRLRRCDDLVDAQVAVACGPGTDLHGLVGHGGERRTSVGLGDDGNRLHPEAAGGLDDANGDFAAIGDQDFLQHGRLCLWHPGGAGGNRSVYTPPRLPL